MAAKDVAEAIAFLAVSDDRKLLRDVLASIRPRAARAVGAFERDRRRVPPPAEIDAADQPASRDAALRTVNGTRDFAELQALARAAGRRLEELQAASK
jgi:hypothetical protein